MAAVNQVAPNFAEILHLTNLVLRQLPSQLPTFVGELAGIPWSAGVGQLPYLPFTMQCIAQKSHINTGIPDCQYCFRTATSAKIRGDRHGDDDPFGDR